MPMTFITGSKNKFEEVRQIVPDIDMLDIDLPEIQEVDPHKIITAKLQAARQHHKGDLIVEDTSLYFECLGGLPGPLIKWFLKSMSLEDLADIAIKKGNPSAVAKTIIGCLPADGQPVFFEGDTNGTIVAPRGEGFGWDAIFQPDGWQQTFSEVSVEKKSEVSMRRRAAEQLKKHLDGLTN